MRNRSLISGWILYALIVIILMLSGYHSGAQTALPKQRFHTSGMVVGFGSRFPTYEYYKVCFIAADYSWSFSKQPKKKDFAAFYAEPQFNPVKTERGGDMEFGVNVGIRNYIQINSGLYFYQMLGSGPHYISAQLKRQASGFIFSDNLFAGVLTRLHRNTFLNVQFGIRHISNAELKRPNKGMNTFNIRVGLSRKR